MSELTQCNYCTLRDLRDRARAMGKIVVLRRGNHVDTLGQGMDIYILAANDIPSENNRVAWMMEIGDRCGC